MILICRTCFRVRLKEVHPLATNSKAMLITRQSHQGMKSVPEFITQLVQWWCLSVPDGLIFVTRSKWARAGSNSNIFILSPSLQHPPGYSSDRVPPHTTLCWAETIFWECWLALLLTSVLCSGHSSSIAYLNKRIQNHLIKERSPLKTGNSVPRRSKDKVAVIAPVEVNCHYLMRFPWFLSLHCFEIGIPYSV